MSQEKDNINVDEQEEVQNEQEQGQQKKQFTQEEVDKIIADRLARAEKKKDEAVKEAEKLAKMNAQQKQEYENEKLKKELEELRAEKALGTMRSEARKMLADENIIANDGVLNFIVTSTADDTKANVEAFAKLFNDAVKAQVQQQLKQDTPDTFKSSGLTKAEILTIQDDAQRQLAIANNLHLFN